MMDTARMNNIANIVRNHHFSGGLCLGWGGVVLGGLKVCLPHLKSRVNSSTAKQMTMTTNISSNVDDEIMADSATADLGTRCILVTGRRKYAGKVAVRDEGFTLIVNNSDEA